MYVYIYIYIRQQLLELPNQKIYLDNLLVNTYLQNCMENNQF